MKIPAESTLTVLLGLVAFVPATLHAAFISKFVNWMIYLHDMPGDIQLGSSNASYQPVL